jgi:hypothetical protein
VERISASWVKKIPSLCSPKGLALSGMGQGSGVFPRPGEAVLLPLNEKRWDPFTPRLRFLSIKIIRH